MSMFYFFVRSWRFVLLLLRSQPVVELSCLCLARAIAVSRLHPFADHLRSLRTPQLCLVRYPNCRWHRDRSTILCTSNRSRQKTSLGIFRGFLGLILSLVARYNTNLLQTTSQPPNRSPTRIHHVQQYYSNCAAAAARTAPHLPTHPPTQLPCTATQQYVQQCMSTFMYVFLLIKCIVYRESLNVIKGHIFLNY